MNPFLAALLWAPLSFGLHVGMHEASHAGAALMLGYPVGGFGIEDGHAVTYLPDIKNPYHDAITVGAPAAVDVAYSLWMMRMAFQVEDPAWKAVFYVEAGMSITFLATWCLGAWTQKYGTDGERFGRKTGFEARFLIAIPVGLALAAIMPEVLR